jgi:hypothetical protein
MTTQTLTLRHQTRLAVNVIIEDDTGVLAYSILLVTRLFTYLWKISQFVMTTRRELSLLVTDFKAALDFTTKVFAIGFNSLAYGLGITL